MRPLARPPAAWTVSETRPGFVTCLASLNGHRSRMREVPWPFHTRGNRAQDGTVTCPKSSSRGGSCHMGV